jgi:hypothetical protein
MVYITCHKRFGTRAFFLYHGAKHGGKASTKMNPGRMYEGFHFWHADLTDAEVQHLKDVSYYASDKTLDAFEQRMGAAMRAAMQEDPFNACYFLVRTRRHPQYHAISTRSASSW